MKLCQSLNRDRISDLPVNVIESILACLPIRDAVRTSILSREWRYKWATLPELIFDLSFGDSFMHKQEELLKFIDRVIFLHRGPIDKFYLSCEFDYCTENSTDKIDQWMSLVLRNGIKELTLNVFVLVPYHYEMPSSLFSCKQLNHLGLTHCTLRSPPEFQGLKFLRSLILHDVRFVGFTFQNMISSCPLLESMILEVFSVDTNLIFNTPKLKHLCLIGLFKGICFKYAPILANLTIRRWDSVGGDDLYHEHYGSSNLIEVLGCLVGLEKLDMDEEFLESLVVGAVPRRLPNAYHHLMILELEGLKFHDLGVLSATLCLVRSSPNLQELVIWADTDVDANMEAVTEFLREQDGADCSLNQLQNVKLKWFSGATPELEFIKFLLTISPVLETMSIDIYTRGVLDAIVESRVLKELIQCPKVSPNAKIVVDS